MRLLLDTHVYLWARLGSARLPQRFAAAILSPQNTKYVSAVSLAEIAVKTTIGKLPLAAGASLELENTGYDPLDFTAAHAQSLAQLPLYHRDPFDRMLLAQAISENLVFLTVDEKCRQYQVASL